jgi:hypothetical protein
VNTGVVLLLVTLSLNVFAKPNCAKVMNELEAMKRAQSVLLNSFVEKNELVASALDNYADRMNDQKQRRQTLAAQDIQSLKQSAQDFRQHKTREQKLVRKFQKASGEVLAQAIVCLQSRTETKLPTLGQK